MRVYWRYHRVESGDTLSEIARRYHTTATAIAEANNLAGNELASESKLIIPVSPAKASASEPASRVAVQGYSKHPAHYTVRKGDTILSVADDFGVPAEKIRQWNHLRGNALRAGRSLTIFKPAAAAVVERTSVTSRARRPRSGAAQARREHAASPLRKSAGRGRTGSKAAKIAPPARRQPAKQPAKSSPAPGRKHKRQR
jgi:membrane-bound lytic murein transglycosylase D